MALWGLGGYALHYMTIKDKLIIYIYRKNNQLEEQTEDLNRQLRFQPMDSLDMYENMRQKVYISAWKEFVSELFKIVINCK